MPGQHSDDQRLLGAYVAKSLVAKIDAGIDDGTLKGSRSDILRIAVCELMERHGAKISDKERRAPPRTGKGGPIRYKIPRGPRSSNRPAPLASNSKPASSAEAFLGAAEEPDPPPRPRPPGAKR